MPLRLTIAWLVVALPLAWGVSRSLQKSMPLFVPPQAQTASAKP